MSFFNRWSFKSTKGERLIVADEAREGFIEVTTELSLLEDFNRWKTEESLWAGESAKAHSRWWRQGTVSHPVPLLTALGIISGKEFTGCVDGLKLEAERAKEEPSFKLGWLVRC